MDNLETVDSPPESKSTKRRSQIFKRQSINPQIEESTNNDGETSHDSEKIKLGSNKELESQSFDLQEYINSLKKEAQDWREEYQKRKSRVQDLTKRVNILEKEGQPLDLSCLSDSEKAFLAARPNYEEFNKLLFELTDAATKVAYLNLHAQNYCEKTELKLKNDVDKAARRIMKLSD